MRQAARNIFFMAFDGCGEACEVACAWVVCACNSVATIAFRFIRRVFLRAYPGFAELDFEFDPHFFFSGIYFWIRFAHECMTCSSQNTLVLFRLIFFCFKGVCLVRIIG